MNVLERFSVLVHVFWNPGSAFSIVSRFFPPLRDNVFHVYKSSFPHKCRAWLRVVGNCGLVFRGDISSKWMFKIWAGKPFISIYSYLPNIWLNLVYLYKKVTLFQRVLFTQMNLTSPHNFLEEKEEASKGNKTLLKGRKRRKPCRQEVIVQQFLGKSSSCLQFSSSNVFFFFS